MNEASGGRRMTVREVAEALGVSPETVKGHIRELWPALMQNGVATYLDETQATVILDKMKMSKFTMAHIGDQQEYKSDLQRNFEGTETSKSRALRIALLQKQIEAELEAEIAELRAGAEADKPKGRA